MNKQRNAVERFPQDLADQIKTILAQRLYSELSDAKLERQKIVRALALINASVDEVYGRQAKHFDKAVDALVKAASTSEVPAAGRSKSGR